jgi:DNA repair protein RadC
MHQTIPETSERPTPHRTYRIPVYGLRLVRERTETYTAERCRNAPDVARLVSYVIGDRPGEILIVVGLDARNQIRKVVQVAQGGLSGLHVAVSDVLRAALATACPSFVLSHNHPSGDPTPSAEDLAFTKRLKDGARTIGLHLADHVVCTIDPRTFHSMLDAGEL